MNWFRRDRVLVVVGGTNLEHQKSDVEWLCGRAYASVYGLRGELLPGGAVADAPCYWNKWKPASPKMQEFYARNTQAAGEQDRKAAP